MDMEVVLEWLGVVVAVVTFLDAVASGLVRLSGATPWDWDDAPASAFQRFMVGVRDILARFSLLRNFKFLALAVILPTFIGIQGCTGSPLHAMGTTLAANKAYLTTVCESAFPGEPDDARIARCQAAADAYEHAWTAYSKAYECVEVIEHADAAVGRAHSVITGE